MLNLKLQSFLHKKICCGHQTWQKLHFCSFSSLLEKYRDFVCFCLLATKRNRTSLAICRYLKWICFDKSLVSHPNPLPRHKLRLISTFVLRQKSYHSLVCSFSPKMTSIFGVPLLIFNFLSWAKPAYTKIKNWFRECRLFNINIDDTHFISKLLLFKVVQL